MSGLMAAYIENIEEPCLMGIIETLRRGKDPMNTLNLPGAKMPNATDKAAISFYTGNP